MTTEFDGGPLKGEFLGTGKTVNTMAKQLASFASEVTRCADRTRYRGYRDLWEDLHDHIIADSRTHEESSRSSPRRGGVLGAENASLVAEYRLTIKPAAKELDRWPDKVVSRGAVKSRSTRIRGRPSGANNSEGRRSVGRSEKVTRE
jgi:hypothetical protein